MTFITVRCPHCESEQIVKRVTGCKFLRVSTLGPCPIVEGKNGRP